MFLNFPIKITEELCQFLLRRNQHFPSFVETDYPLSTPPHTHTHTPQTFSFLPFRAHNVIWPALLAYMASGPSAPGRRSEDPNRPSASDRLPGCGCDSLTWTYILGVEIIYDDEAMSPWYVIMSFYIINDLVHLDTLYRKKWKVEL